MTDSTVLAYVALDCAAKQRVRYSLPQPVTEDFLARFSPEEVSIQRFSTIARGAMDHFSIRQGGAMAAGGVLGEPGITVTYGKFGTPGGEPVARRSFETHLTDYFGSPVRVLHRDPS